MTIAPIITRIAPWFGSKSRLAPRIVEEIGQHKAYAELFCGSCAVLLAKPEASMEIANDLYGSVINLARVLASEHHATLKERASRLLMHEQLFVEFKAKCRDSEHAVAESSDAVTDEHVDAAIAFFVRSWMGRNGAAGTHESNATMARRFTSNGGSGGLRWHQAVQSIDAWHERLKRVQWSQMGAIEMAERIDDSDAWAIYADPPYLKKGTKYIHDFAPEDHERLAAALDAKRNARVLVSYYDDPLLDELYPPSRWTKVPMPIAKGLTNQGMRDEQGAVLAPEVLLINGESYTHGGLFS